MLKKSPSGSLCPYYYKGGELHPLHYGSYHDNLIELTNIMAAEEKFILSSAGNRNRRIWVDLYETNLTEDMIGKLAQHIAGISIKTSKIAFVGCSKRTLKKVNKYLEKLKCRFAGQIRLFSDPELAKSWLVSETQSLSL